MKLALPDLVSNSYFPAIAAVELGCFEREGLDIQLELHFPVTSAMAGLREGRFDFVAGAAHTVPTAFPNWHGARLLAALARHMYWFLVLRRDLNVQRGDLRALRGLRIGAAPGVDMGLRGLLQVAGIDPGQKGIQIAPVPGTDQPSVSFGVTAAAALAAGRVDGFWANGMGAEVATSSGAGTVVLDVRRGDGPAAARDFTFPALVMTEERVEREPEVAAAAVRALVRAQTVLRRDPSQAAAIGARLFPPEEAGMIEGLIQRDLPYYDAAITPEMVAGLNQLATSTGLTAGPVAREQIVALRFAPLWQPEDPVPGPGVDPPEAGPHPGPLPSVGEGEKE